MNATATSFSTLKDLRNYINCLLGGGGANACLNEGDNGTGAWGDNIAVLTVAYCALPTSEMRSRWGDADLAHNKKVRVTLSLGSKEPFICIVGDKGPDGVIDLNPGSLQAAGLSTDTELSCDATWEWLDDEQQQHVDS